MTENPTTETGHTAETPPATPPIPEQNTRQAASWLELKGMYQDQVTEAGLGAIPEPDSRDFPPFLAKLNTINPVLARELVTETWNLRRGVELPSSSASKRRQRNRETRRFLLMKQTADGRWVLDKQKAPMYGMIGLLAVGGLLTAIYALPRLDGRGLIETKTPTPTRVQDDGVTPAPVTPDPASEQALKESREQLRKIREERGVATLPTTPKPDITLPTGGSPAPATTPLTQVRNPPPPPAVNSTRTPTSVYRPVPTPTASTAPGQAVQYPAARTTPEINSWSYDPPAAQALAPAPVILSTPEQPTQAATRAQPAQESRMVAVSAPPLSDVPQITTTPEVKAAVKPPAKSPATTPARTAVTASSAKPVVKETPANTTAPVQTSSAPLPVNTAPQTNASAQTESAQSVPFGGYYEASTPPTDLAMASQADAPPSVEVNTNPAAYLSPASTRSVYGGMVYQRKAQAAPSPTSTSPAAPSAPPTATGEGSSATPTVATTPTPAGTTGAETPFGSNVTNASSKIGATGPFKALQQIQAALLTGIRTPNGGSVEVVSMAADGGAFVGVATVNATLARVDMQFRRYIAPDGKIYEINALAYAKEGSGGLMQGVPATVEPIAPTLGLDAAQNSANALNTYVQNLAAAATKAGPNTSINLGDGMTISGPSVASLTQTLLGGLGSTFKMPENTQSITRVATVKTNAQMVIIVGLGGRQ